MNLLLLLPIGLAALASLLLPLLVHLARRSEQRVVPFAALRWLRAQPQPRRKHRFEELLLLCVRLLLLTALALLIAQPVLFGRPDHRPWVVVPPQVDAVAARAQVRAESARWHRLAPGFPELDAKLDDRRSALSKTASSAREQEFATFASLLRELDATLPVSVALTVIVPATIDGADAQRPVLSRKVDWRVLPAGAPARSDARVPGDQRAISLAVHHVPERAASLRYLRAAGVAWMTGPATDLQGSSFQRRPEPSTSRAEEEAGSRPSPGRRRGTAATANPITDASVSQPLEADVRNIVWLAPGPVPESVRDRVAGGARALLDADAQWPGFDAEAPVLWQDASGPLVRGMRFGRGHVMRLERALLPAAMPVLLEPDFPRRLRALFEDPPPAPTRVDAADYAPLAGAAPYPEQPRPLSPWLIWAVALLFLLERWLASGRRRSESP